MFFDQQDLSIMQEKLVVQKKNPREHFLDICGKKSE